MPTISHSLATGTQFAQAKSWLARMTPAQKVGQVMVVGFDHAAITPDLQAMLEQCHVGGVVLMTRNVESPAQVAKLTAGLQEAARASGHPGLLLAVDQEGGRVARLSEAHGFTEFPSAMALAATGEVENARRAARALAAEMKSVGLNVNFAPVLDVNNNPANPVIGTRSFGSDPQRVAEFGVAFLQTLQSEGVLAIGKHFPGHGDTSIDSHLALPLVPHDRARLEAIEFVPFRAAMAAGVAGIMSAHVAFPAIDSSGVPATLSPATLTGLLREDLGYQGLAVTDSLEMGALSSSLQLNPAQAAAAALQAGADVLLFNKGHQEQRDAHALILARLQSGQLSPARLDEAALRVLTAKARFGLLDPAPVDPAWPGQVGSSAQRTLAQNLAAQSITLLRDDAAWLPLRPEMQALVVETPPLEGLGALLGAERVTLDVEPDNGAIRKLVRAARAGQAIVLGISEIAQYPAQAELIEAVLQTGTPVILVAVRDPYDLLAFPAAPTILAIYGRPAPAMRALAAVLRGDASPAGCLPVSLPGLFPLGAGLRGFARRSASD